MKNKIFHHNIFIFFFLIILKCCARILSERNNIVFGECLKDSMAINLQECVGLKAIHYLHSIENSKNFTLTNGLTVIKNENEEVNTRILDEERDNIQNENPLDFR